MADNSLILSKMLGQIYTEVFQRTEQNFNAPLNISSHEQEVQVEQDTIKSLLRTNTNTYVWGPGGVSDEVDVSGSSARWGESHWG